MPISPRLAKLMKKYFEELILSKNWMEFLFQGKLYEFEKLLYASFTELYNKICQCLILEVTQSLVFQNSQRSLAQDLGLKKLELRPCELQLRTGFKVKYEDFYAKKVPKDYTGKERHLSRLLWSSRKHSSPMYMSLIGLLSVLCPSFNLTKTLLRYMGIVANEDRVRSLALTLGERCMEDRANCSLAEGESLAGKHVLIGIDGGRIRQRVYKKEKGKKRNTSFDTPWREPKLFVITTIDEQGKISKDTLPIYDGTFTDVAVVQLLKEYLAKLDVSLALSVQLVADGAPWIWNQLPEMLLDVGLDKHKIIETLDYYHAMEHLHELKVYLPKKAQAQLFEQLKEALWQGNTQQIGEILKENIKDIDLENFTPYLYFEKNRNRIDYQRLKAEKRPIGSGIIESGIRRIINLRLKAPSSFWYPDNVEKLLLLRSIALSGRWEIMMNNLTKKH